MKRSSSFRRILLSLVTFFVVGGSFISLASCNSSSSGSGDLPQENINEEPMPEPIYFENEHDYLFYSDDYFKHRASTYNEHLATLSLYMAKYSQNPGGPDNLEDYEWYRNQSLRLAEFYKLIGFGHQLFNDDYYSRTGFNTVGIGCASRKIKEGNNEFTVIACTVRSGGYFLEWENNVFLGTGENSDMMHEGWYNAANRVIEFINYYVIELRNNHFLETDQIKLWMSGFSRGGAIINLTAGLLDNKLGYDDKETRYSIFSGVNLKREDILTYTFEAPQGANFNSKTVEKPRDALYNNIYNIVNPNDLVTKVAMGRFGFTRFGIDKFITTEFFDPQPFEQNRNVVKNFAHLKDKNYNWVADNFSMYGIDWAAFVLDVGAFTSASGAILNWLVTGDALPDIIQDDTNKVNYDANIVLDILIDRAIDNLGNRDAYCNSFQTFARKLMHYMFNDVPESEPATWEDLLFSVGIQGLASIIFPGSEIITDHRIEEMTGATAAEIKAAVFIAGDVFFEYPSEFVSMIKNIGDVFENHSTQLNIYHAQAQDSYYLRWYNDKKMTTRVTKVPYRNNSELVRMECLDINQGEIHLDDQKVVELKGSDVGTSTIVQCNPGYAIGYYHYATYERSEWFLPACYLLAYGFYSHSDKPWHHVYVHRWTYRTNQNADRTGLYIVDEYYNGDSEVISGHIDPDVDPESSRLDDLTNSKWIIHTDFFAPISEIYEKLINFESNGEKFERFRAVKMTTSSLDINVVIFYNDHKAGEATDVWNEDVQTWVPHINWKKEAYPTISISGGDDAKNVELINWLYDHADLIG